MPVVVIRLHPIKPTTGASFAAFLEGLTITIADRSFAHPEGEDAAHQLGSATYLAGDPASAIVQHQELAPPVGPMVDTTVATAAIEVPDPLPFAEYGGPDLLLTVTRDEAPNPVRTILVKALNFNVDVAPGSLPAVNSPANYESLGPVALYLALPEPLTGLAPGTAFVDIPTDGTPPAYQAVLAAMQNVLAADPQSGIPAISSLTPQQCRHIASEIVSNRRLDPLPDPGRPLQDLYRDPGSDEGARREFESELITFYAVHNTRADLLAKFVYSVAAAVSCTERTQAALQVGLTLPVLPGLVPTSGAVPTVSVVVTQ